MKNAMMFCSLLVLTSLPAMAAQSVLVKSCLTTLSMPDSGDKVETKIDIVKEGTTLKAIVTQNGNTYKDVAVVEADSVQAGLNAGQLETAEIDSMNLAERLITHAIAITEDPIMEGAFSVGLELKDVRSATVYSVGIAGNMGMTAIVEAKDGSGKDMGSFLGGFLVSPCK
ncbi:MAG: hypothetical protein H7336_04900 [Bacteriovorax sp.]|nr:hypothetical protein [Bacteriovorax sp.]